MGIKTVLTCDCGKKLELEGPYFMAKPAMKEAGWRNVKVGDDWKIKCPECREKKG